MIKLRSEKPDTETFSAAYVRGTYMPCFCLAREIGLFTVQVARHSLHLAARKHPIKILIRMTAYYHRTFDLRLHLRCFCDLRRQTSTFVSPAPGVPTSAIACSTKDTPAGSTHSRDEACREEENSVTSMPRNLQDSGLGEACGLQLYIFPP